MKETRIRNIIREVIEELCSGNQSVYNPTHATHFPYNDENYVVPPSEINASNNSFVTKTNSDSQEVNNWTEEEFGLGLSVEKKRCPNASTSDHRKVVLKNLKDDNLFYSKLISA